MAKRTGDMFASVRERGLLNSMLDVPAEQFEATHPGMRCKWEYAPPSGDVTMITLREAQGFKVVEAKDMPQQDSSQKTGPIRRGDQILMYAPAAVFQELERMDAQVAQDDYKTPERAYKDHLEEQQYRLSSGEVRRGRPFGDIKRTVEEASIPTGKGGETE